MVKSDGEIGECFTTKKGTKLSSRKTGGPLGRRWMISEHQLRGNKREQLCHDVTDIMAKNKEN